MPRPVLPLALAALLALAGCGGMVAPDAPPLLSAEDLAARRAEASSPARTSAVESGLNARAASLRARAAALRRQSAAPAPAADSDLLRRAALLREAG